MKPSHLVILALLIVIGVFVFIRHSESENTWVAGRYGEKCYPKGYEDPRIHYKVYFNSEKACQNFVGE